jgi:Zn-dependent protease with chaperone function
MPPLTSSHPREDHRSRPADDVLAVIARPGPAADIRIIDSDRPAVYCLPGRRRIVLTSGALSYLDRGQLDAVLAHERAHLSGHHHLALRLASTLEHAFPGVRFFAVAAQQVTYLEVAADDAAVRRTSRLTMAAALLAVAAAGIPAGALGAGGSAAAQRIERLIDPPLRYSRVRRAFTYAAMATAAALAITALALAFSTIFRCPPMSYA